MKILCEVPLEVKQYDQSQFHWLKGSENYLFSLENRSKLRMFSIKQTQLETVAREVQSASLAGARQFTSLSWNKDESLLAVVVDKRQIYMWEVERNNFTQFKPRSTHQTNNPMVSTGSGGSNLGAGQQSGKANKSIEIVAWSKLTNKLAICYASGQILLCELKLEASTSAEDKPTQAHKNQEAAGSGRFTSTWERFISNSESVLKQIVSIEVSEQAELFACFSSSSELLIMTFDGRMVFYSQGEQTNLSNAKFSPLRREHDARTGQYLGQTICLAYQSDCDVLMLKRVTLDAEFEFNQSSPTASLMLHENHHDRDERRNSIAIPLVDYHWLGPTQLLICFASGSIQMVQLDPAATTAGSRASSPTLTADGGRGGRAIVQIVNSSGQQIQCTEVLRLRAQPQPPIGLNLESGLAGAAAAAPASEPQPEHAAPRENSINAFEIFEMTSSGDSALCYALAIGTSYQLHYYALVQEPSGEFSLEHCDDIDLGESLERVKLRLERARWSQDCSMLALQLTSGHLLVYRTRLEDYMVAAHSSRAAYLSAANEVTILNYAREQANGDEPTSQETTTTSGSHNVRAADNAHILAVQLRPSLLAIGPRHLALALNNRVRFYSLDSLHQTGGDQCTRYHEREYAAIVAGVGLCSRFAAIQFQHEGRLKLHSLKSRQTMGQENGDNENDDDDDDGEERLFPDPSQPERIAAFALTEQLLVYSTRGCQLAVFCLKAWRLVRVCNHSRLCREPVWRLKPNARGNKFVCLIEPGCATGGSLSSADMNRRKMTNRAPGRGNGSVVFLYDLYTNYVYAIGGSRETATEAPLWPRLVAHQIQLICAPLPLGETTVNRLLKEAGLGQGVASRVRIVGATDAIWDTDGRSVLIIEQKSVHAFAVLDHTLECEGPVAVYASSTKKPSSHTTLYVHQGIVSYQTSLGRVLNSILETHDDELKLTKLEMRIRAIKHRYHTAITGEDGQAEHGQQLERDPRRLEAHLEVMLLKVGCFCTLLSIYPLTKCRDICKDLMENEAFNLDADAKQTDELDAHNTIDQTLWQVLAAWSLFTLNLDYASLICRRNNLRVQSDLLAVLLKDIKEGRSNMTMATVRERILTLLTTDPE